MSMSDGSGAASDGAADSSSLSSLQQIARGSAWSVAARWSVRAIGLISTVMLARLLQPADFGIVAMAMVAVAFVSVFSEIGEHLAVIRHPDPTAEHFDTAWTMAVCAGFLVALVLIAIAPVAEWYFQEPRVVPVIRLLALAPLIEGFTNIGVTAGFQRDLAFDKDFRYTVLRKLSSFVVTVPLALIWQDYWALAVGVVFGRVLIVVASYRMHPYRPRLRLPKLSEIWSFSAWTQFTAIGGLFANQADQIIVGGITGTAQMGAYNVAADVATAPTVELVSPASRAVFPVYAKLLHDPAGLTQSYLGVLSVTAIVALSTGVGVALVADDMVAVVLGPQWVSAALLVPWFALGAAMSGVAESAHSMLSVTGYARLNAMRVWAFGALLAPAAIVAGLEWGIVGVAAARAAVTLVFVPVMFHSLMRVIPLTSAEIIACLWRPALAALVMTAAVWVSGTDAISPVPLRLICNIGLAASVFTMALLALWFLAGRADGAEHMLLMQARRLVPRLAARFRSV